MVSSRKDLTFKINNLIGLMIFSLVFFIGSFIYIAIKVQFPYWWVLSFLIVGQIILDIFHIIYLKRVDAYSRNVSEFITNKILWITIAQFFVLNIFVFVSGIWVYKKIVSPLNIYF